MPNASVAGVILAAGKGTRMKSDLPKGLHPVCGLPMVELVGRALKSVGVCRPVVVIGHGGDLMQAALGDSYDYVWQHEQLGTGHAAMMALERLKVHEGPVLIVPGDAPLLDEDMLRAVIDAHLEARADCTLATAVVEDATGYGRIVRDHHGHITRIVEERDALPDQRLIREVNTSVYCFDAAELVACLPALGNLNAQQEYYLTDAVSLLHETGKRVQAVALRDAAALIGVNDRWQLAQATKALRLKILKAHAVSGVTIIDPDTTFLGPDVSIGPDTVIEPCVFLEGRVSIGSRSHIGPSTRIENSSIGNDTTISMSQVVGSQVGSHIWVGPFSNIRPGTVLSDDVKVGDFVEIKASFIGQGAKVPHLSYVGDATIGRRTNFGAGAITANYDGFNKFKTEIGDDAFIGTNATLVAPVIVGDGAMITAGSTITNDVPDEAAGFGRARQETKDGWATEFRRKRQSKQS